MVVTASRVKRFMLSVICTAVFKQSHEKNENIKYIDFLPIYTTILSEDL